MPDPTPPNFKSGTVWTGDNLPIMRGMNSDCIDLIYLDPPFNSNANYAAPVGSTAAGAAFKDTWSLNDIDVAWLNLIEEKHPSLWRAIQAAMSDSDKSYLVYMAARLIEMKRILKPSGSIYLHCDPTMSHYLKIMMDGIFGRENFMNEIIWCYPPKGKAPNFGFHKKHDIIFYYRKNLEGVFNHQYTDLNDKQIAKFSKKDENGRSYKEFKGRRTYLDESRGRPVPSWWTDIGQTVQSRIEYVGYPTQTPLALLDRIIKASSNEGDLVFDPFCGCATSLVAANRLNRQWAGIDLSAKAVELVDRRIRGDFPLFGGAICRTDIPQRTDLGSMPRYNHPDNREALYGAQGGYCTGCNTHFKPQNLTIDHIIASGQGGTDHIDNLQLLCGNCNSIKGNRGMEYLKAKLGV